MKFFTQEQRLYLITKSCLMNISGLTFKSSIADLLHAYSLSETDLCNLLDVGRGNYLKINTESKGPEWLLVLNAYFKLPNSRSILKISTYHDIKEVMYDNKAKSNRKSTRRYLVMGTKLKQEMWDTKIQDYLLQ